MQVESLHKRSFYFTVKRLLQGTKPLQQSFVLFDYQKTKIYLVVFVSK